MRLTGGFWYSVGCLCLLGPWCWQTLAVGNSWLLIFQYSYLLYLSYIWLALVYSMMILNMSTQQTATPGGGGGGMSSDYIIIIALTSHLLFT